jgi:hypothetical protein
VRGKGRADGLAVLLAHILLAVLGEDARQLAPEHVDLCPRKQTRNKEIALFPERSGLVGCQWHRGLPGRGRSGFVKASGAICAIPRGQRQYAPSPGRTEPRHASALLSLVLYLKLDREEALAEGETIGYPRLAGFELEDGIYLLAPLAWLGFLTPFFVAAGIGAVVYCLWTLGRVVAVRMRARF